MADGKIEALVAAPRREGQGVAARVRAFYFARRPWIVLGMGVYLLLVHLVAAYLFARSNGPGQIAWKLGLGSRWAEFDSTFRGRNSQLRRLAGQIEPGGALFIGDSLLASLDVGALADRGVQLSIPGDTTRRVLARVRDYGLAEARVVVFHVGTNDLLFRRPAGLHQPYARLLTEVPAAVPVVLSAALPIDERATDRYGNADVRALNRVMAQACAERPGCTFVDGAPAVTDAGGGLDPRYHVGDGIHLSGAGYRVWRDALAPALAPWRRP